MEYCISSAEMKRCDRVTIANIGIPSLVLVERAALCALASLEGFDLARVLVVCGSGNNGADGLALARLLHIKGVSVDLLFVGDESKRTAENRSEADILEKHGLQPVSDTDFDRYTTIVDALFGIGLTKPTEGKYKDTIEHINHSSAKVLSLDIPSGISADTGRVCGVAVRADKTVTFAYKKTGLILYPGAEYAGIVEVGDIGISDAAFEGAVPGVCAHTPADLALIPQRKPYSNKGTYGKVLVIGGGMNMCGAAIFSAKAAYRVGAGLVKVCVPEGNRIILQTAVPEAILSTYAPGSIDFQGLQSDIAWADIIVLGPGLGMDGDSEALLKYVLSASETPLVIDADALNLLAKEPSLLNGYPGEIVLTPHPGEMSRLTGKTVDAIAESLIDEAAAFAKRYGVICVLKDARTVTADRDGRLFLNQSGNNGMATGGSGDVLTGIIAGLAAQGAALRLSASLGVYIHGLAGDAAAERYGAYAVTANEIIGGISDIVR